MNYYLTFISSEELFQLYKSTNLVVIDCRFDLSAPDWGYDNYLISHLPNAVYAHLDRDLSGKNTDYSGRHPLPEIDKFIQTSSQWGISDQKQVVVYDTSSGSYAARLWWMLKLYGHENVAILDGGLSAWIQAGYHIESGNVSNEPSVFSGKPDNSNLVTTSEMEKIIENEDFSIIDARSFERYTGKEEPIDTLAGRIPHSINFFHQDHFGEDGKLLSTENLLNKYKNLLSEKINSNKVVYCGSGVTSCLNVAVMQHIGISNTRLYLGSWSEWIKNPNHPIINDFLNRKHS